MKQRLTRPLTGLLLASVLLTSSCAGSYTAIRPDHMATYQSSAPAAPLQFSYQYNALGLRGHNKKYVKKERKKGYQVVAVRITNNTSADVNFSRDAVLYCGDRPVMPINSTLAASDMKQGVFIYLLYLLANVNVGGTRDPYTGQTTGGTFVPTGVFIAGGNMLGAHLANQNFLKELENYDLTDRTIHPGETVNGIISLRETNVAPLRLELRTVASNLPAPARPAATPPALPPAATPLPGGGR